jgi:Excalibur calcium-binding domain
MSVSRRTRLSLIGAAASGVLVMAMTGTALAAGHEDHPDCSESVQAALDTAAPAERPQLPDLCRSIPVLNTDDTEDAEDGTPDTTPAAAPDEDEADDSSAEDGDEKKGDDEKSDDKDSDEKSDDDGDKGGKDGKGDRDCADFDSQADAQAAFEESSNDEERLDADDDGVACEDHFGTEDQQVAVHPRGGVATGGAGL